MDPVILTNTTNNIPKKSVQNVPLSDVDFLTVAKVVATTWAANPTFTLLWTNVTDFTTLVNNYETTYHARKQGGSVRPQYTKQLKALDKTINDSLMFIKNYLSDKYGKDNAPSYYAEFGIEKNNKSYTLPKDRNSRGTSLTMLLAAIDTHGFTTMNYGKTYWQPLVTQYNTLLLQSQQTDSTISQNVGNKNIIKEQIREVLNSLILLIKANYPNSFKNELRTWGFQKEKY